MRPQQFLFALAAALATIAPSATGAAPQQLRCVLTDTATRPASENRPLLVVFDDSAATLTAEESDRRYVFRNVSISNVSINGQVDNVSLGIDRSSLGIVWQRYDGDTVVAEFGRCRPTADTATPAAR